MAFFNPYTPSHWRLVARLYRVIGIGFVLWGIGFAAWGIELVMRLDRPFWVNGIEDHTLGPRLTMAVAAGLMALLGFRLLCVRSYRPDLGDTNWFDRFVDPFGSRGPRGPTGRRSWWTGDPLP